MYLSWFLYLLVSLFGYNKYRFGPPSLEFPFQFQNFWTNYPKVGQIIMSKWKLNERGSNMYRFMRKLKAIKNDLKPWVKSNLGNTQDKPEKNLDKINYYRG